ncbi:MAG: leucyl/phenylalanyl-tRNA--protein transferase [Myxococcales bacterium]|nr:leucyl/phenylalanyl-tRNA--protein transferase [Myxococcales bacterium]
MAVPFPPLEPPPARVEFPSPRDLGDEDVAAVGGDFSPSTLLLAYRSGIFPWPNGRLVGWFSPDPRAIFPLERAHFSRSLVRTLRRRVLGRRPFVVTVDAAFQEVMRLSAETRPEGTWITPPLFRGYVKLHEMGWAHSVEVWLEGGESRELVGGIYGLSIGGLFAGESMFHLCTDASKVAFAHLVARLTAAGAELFDVQVPNEHLTSLGCVSLPRDAYLDRLANALDKPSCDWGALADVDPWRASGA